MNIKDEKIVNKILNEINEIICDDNFSDTEALETIIMVLKEYNVIK